jgi:PAT family beta-lactamase induction signal transducer AmpG
MLKRWGQILSYLKQPSLLAIFCFGFSSGLPLALTASTLSTWLADVGIDLKTIGIFSLVGLPYAIKFVWSPLLDSLPCPVLTRRLGRRRGWILATQMMVMVLIAGSGQINPTEATIAFACCVFGIAIASASQDIVIDAYRVEILPVELQGAASAMSTFGYRMAMLVSGAGALWLSDHVSWQETYMIMAGCMGVGVITTLCVREPAIDSVVIEQLYARRSAFVWLQQAVIAPFRDFMKREYWYAIVVFVVSFKLADAFLGVMLNPFLLSLGFTKTHIAEIVKLYGFIATLVGTFLGGALVMRYGMYRVLLATTFLHMFTNLLLVAQVSIGLNETFLRFCIVSENITGGMGTAAFISYLSSLCNVRYTATQYALLSSLAAVARTVLSAPSGEVAQALGWSGFFIFSSLLALPALVMLCVYNKHTMHWDKST